MMKNSLTALLVCLSVGFMACQPASAGVVFQIANGGIFDVTPGTSGTFDVLMTVPSGTQLVGYQTAIDVLPTTGFTFDSLVAVTSFGDFFDQSTVDRVQVSDQSPSFTPQEISGSTVLYQVNYSVAGSVTPGSMFSLNFDQAPTVTFALPPSGNPADLAPYSFNDATAKAIPEPSAFFCLAAIGLIVGTGRFSKFLLSHLSIRS